MSKPEEPQLDSRGQIPGVDNCACHGKLCDECLDKYGIEK